MADFCVLCTLMVLLCFLSVFISMSGVVFTMVLIFLCILEILV